MDLPVGITVAKKDLEGWVELGRCVRSNGVTVDNCVARIIVPAGAKISKSTYNAGPYNAGPELTDFDLDRYAWHVPSKRLRTNALWVVEISDDCITGKYASADVKVGEYLSSPFALEHSHEKGLPFVAAREHID